MHKQDKARHTRTNRWRAGLCAAALGLSLAGGSAHALQFDLGPETSLSWTTTLGYAAGYRVQEQDDRILANINGDDGDRAFNTGLMKNEISGLTELELRYRDFGAFVRGDAYYDAAYHGNSDNHSAATDNTPSNPPYKYVDYTRDTHLRDARLLDAFVYGNFDIGSTDLNLRVDRQVVSWGESLFLPGISATQNPVDVTESHNPAAEVKELLLPVAQVLGQWRLTPNLSVAGYYQWQWDASRLDGVGSYFSQSDLFAGGEVFLTNVPGVGIVPTLQRTPDDEPGSDGQYGFNIHYTVPQWAYTDFGAYYIRYHAKTPSLVLGGFIPNPGPGPAIIPTTYHAKFFEDIDLYGLSFNTSLGYVQVGGEASYKKGLPVLDQNQTAVRADAAQVQVNTIANIPINLLWADVTTLTAELGANTITDRDDDELVSDKTAAGYQGQLALSYTNVLPSVDLTVPLSVKQGLYHDSSVLGTFAAGQLQVSLGADFIYQSNWEFVVNYVQFHGDPDDTPLTDRDFVSAEVKYSF